ncbi:MAG: hypothetical protein IT518_18115 [Burkholderiales bacterium]|nr:hypothetical protein [Burkholderiales bacterium]
MHPALLALVLACLSACANAQVYKCAAQGKAPVYQDRPCPDGRELRNFAADPATVSVLPMPQAQGSTMRLAAPPPAKARATGPSEKKGKHRGGNPAERRYLSPGMHEGEVLARIGTPDLKSGGGSRKLARWTYMPVEGDAQTLTTVVFEYGKVVEVERKVVR